MMCKKNYLMLAAGAMLLLSACSSKLGELSADNFTVTPNPLGIQVGQVPATINGAFPEKYMKKKAVVTVTPELRYTANGQTVAQKGTSATFQGEKVLGNDQPISYLVGGRYTMKTTFDYVPEMQKSDLYLTFNARVGNKQVDVPAVKVADGVIATSELYKRTLTSARPATATNGFQRVVEQKQEANIKFLIQQATLRKSELKSNSVQEFVQLLQQINADRESLQLNNIEVSAYASPDGGLQLNDKLANKRQQETEKYVNQLLKQQKMEANVDAKYTAQDWEGFQELVKVSNIQDKDVILRVLSMYKDPEEREQQIKNISSAFRELADGILPQLRRSRIIINYDVVGRSNEEIQEQFKTDATQLNVEELLYGATLTDNLAEQEAIYQKAAQLYGDDARALNNLSTLEFAKGDYQKAWEYAEKALNVNSKSSEALANLGLLALQAGDINAAENYIAQATGANGLPEVLGNLHLAQGKYALAEQDFEGVYSNSAALAQLLNKNYSAAANTLKYVRNADATTDYLKALVSARQGQTADAATALKAAIAKDPSLAKYAANDLELAKVAK